MAAEVPRGSDEAVRRIREESRRRIEQRRGWRAFSSLCALACLVGGVSLAMTNAREARLQRQAEEAVAEVMRAERAALEAAVAEATRVRDRRHQEMCAKLLVGTEPLRARLATELAAARGEKQRARIWAETRARYAPLASAQAEEGCQVTSLEPLVVMPPLPQWRGCTGYGPSHK